MNRQQLQDKLGNVVSVLIKEKGRITFVDVFMELGKYGPSPCIEVRRAV